MKKRIELKQSDYPDIDFDKIVDVPSVNTDKKDTLTIELEVN